MLVAVMAEQIRGGILLVISIGIAVFFFLDAIVNIFKGNKPGVKDQGGIRLQLSLNNEKYEEKVFYLQSDQDGKNRIMVGLGPDNDFNLSDYIHFENAEDELWFVVSKSASGVLTVRKDELISGLQVLGSGDHEYQALTKIKLAGDLRIRKYIGEDELEIRLKQV